MHQDHPVLLFSLYTQRTPFVNLQVVDTRESALCRGFARTYAETQREGANGSKSFIADILNSISDVT